jgi:ABC-2 type transport system permease protein
MLMAPISRAPHGTLATVMSWIPLYTPFTMMARMTSHPPVWEIIGTGISMTAFAVLLVWLLGRLFRVSLLASGGTKRLSDLWRVLASKGP